jgi:hypothetical protein
VFGENFDDRRAVRIELVPIDAAVIGDVVRHENRAFTAVNVLQIRQRRSKVECRPSSSYTT